METSTLMERKFGRNVNSPWTTFQHSTHDLSLNKFRLTKLETNTRICFFASMHQNNKKSSALDSPVCTLALVDQNQITSVR
jgi:hypothetical protein